MLDPFYAQPAQHQSHSLNYFFIPKIRKGLSKVGVQDDILGRADDRLPLLIIVQVCKPGILIFSLLDCFEDNMVCIYPCPGDERARRIAISHGEALGDSAVAAARKVGLLGASFPLVLTGSMLRHPSSFLGAYGRQSPA